VIGASLDRVCIVMMSAIGDSVHVLPVVTALKRYHPRARITWILQPAPASLVRGHPDVDEIIEFHKARGWRAFLEVRRQLQREFDLVLALQVYFKAGVVTAMTNAPVKLGFDRARARDLNWLVTTHRIPAHAPQHVLDQYFEFLDALGVPHDPVEWRLGPWDHERGRQSAFVATLDRPAAAIAFSVTDREREWVPERWGAVCDALYHDFGLQPILVGGNTPRERQLAEHIRAAARVDLVSTLGAPLRDLVGILDASALVVAVNSAPLHMAVAVNRPVVSLLGHWNPKRTGPYRFRDLMVDGYGRPGEEYAASYEKRPGTMSRISVDQVLAAIGRWASAYGPAWNR
jgi:heptosyltransferase I